MEDFDFDLKKEEQLLRSRWAIVKKRVSIISLGASCPRENSKIWGILREWSVYAPSAGYLVPKDALPLLEKIFTLLQETFFAEEINDSLANNRQRKDIIEGFILRPRTLLVEAVKEFEAGKQKKIAYQLLKQRLEKAEIFNIVGDYIFAGYVKRIREALKNENRVLLESVFLKIKENFGKAEEPPQPEEKAPSFYPPEGWKPLIIIRHYGR